MELRNFKYKSHGEVKNREIIIIKENDMCFEGLDKSLLSVEDYKAVSDLLKEFKTRDIGDKAPIDNWNSAWNKAWRRFNKINIIKD